MNHTVRDLMTESPCTMDVGATIEDAAREMRARDIGDVIVCEGNTIVGMLTDRDIAVRAVADGLDPSATRVIDICSRDAITVTPDDPIDRAVILMRDQAVRRLPVVERGTPVGILSIGDLALALDSRSALADISAAPPDR